MLLAFRAAEMIEHQTAGVRELSFVTTARFRLR
jgi:hypothetical protein